MTDNRNRTVAEMRHIFSKYGGNLAESGAVAWIFEKKGSILIEKKASTRTRSWSWPSMPAPRT